MRSSFSPSRDISTLTMDLQNLKMKPAALAFISVISTVSGVGGAFAWPKIAQIFKRTPSQTILICIMVFELIPLYGLLGFIPAVQNSGFGGLTSPWEMYLLGAVYGFVLGGVSGYCRSVYGELSIDPSFLVNPLSWVWFQDSADTQLTQILCSTTRLRSRLLRPIRRHRQRLQHLWSHYRRCANRQIRRYKGRVLVPSSAASAPDTTDCSS